MEIDDYTKAFEYENLIRNAFNCSRGMKNGADLCFMQNAMTMERGETFAKHLGSFEKQFEQVKKYTSNALLKISKAKLYSTNSDFFLNLESNVSFTSSTSELMEIVSEAMEKISELKK
jgi:hypothetical protein